MTPSKKSASTAEIIEQWLYGRPRPTQKAYLRDATWALKFLGNPSLESIVVGDFQRYQLHLIEVRHDSTRTVNRKVSAVRSLLKFAHEQEFIPRNPAVALRSPKVHENLSDRILTPQQVRSIIAAAKPGRDLTMIKFTYLNHCLTEGRQDAHLETAAVSIDTAIDCLNEHLTP